MSPAKPALPTPGQYLTSCRQKRKLTQDQLASLTGAKKQAISAWERDRVPIPATRINDLHRHLGLNRSTLLDAMAKSYRDQLAAVIKSNQPKPA